MCGVMIYVVVVLSFFFFKQKTAYEMRISDWSSDVCSSDLKLPARVYSGMKQNEGTFWTFVINKTSTAIDLMDQVAAKCGIPVEQMSLYAQTEKNVGT